MRGRKERENKEKWERKGERKEDEKSEIEQYIM